MTQNVYTKWELNISFALEIVNFFKKQTHKQMDRGKTKLNIIGSYLFIFTSVCVIHSVFQIHLISGSNNVPLDYATRIVGVVQENHYNLIIRPIGRCTKQKITRGRYRFRYIYFKTQNNDSSIDCRVGIKKRFSLTTTHISVRWK